MGEKTKKKGSISYAKWGYIFIAPFFIIFAVFQLIPLISTCLLYTSPSPRDLSTSRMPSSA